MKTNSLNANVASYMSLPFTIVLKKDDEGDYVSRIEELPGCVAHGSSEVEAVQQLRRMQQLWIRDCLEAGDKIPEPKEEQGLPSGKWVQRVPRGVHKRLAEKAKSEGVSLNQLVTTILAEALGASSTAPRAARDRAANAFRSERTTSKRVKR
jgi:antitoxin HicB